MNSVSQRIAEELLVHERQVTAAIELLDDGATVPFIARYRKEVTDGLDDTQLRNLEDRLRYLRELDDRRAAVLKSIDEQGKLTESLKASILAADTKIRLEDLYLPYKQKRRTKAEIAREAGLQPLAMALLADPSLDPWVSAVDYVNDAVADPKAALDGARQILMERFAEDADLLAALRDYLTTHGVIKSTVTPDKAQVGAKYSDYFDYSEALGKIPSHRALALFRGRNEGILQVSLQIANEADFETHPCEGLIARKFNVENLGRPGDAFLQETVRWAWKVKIFIHLDLELKMQLKSRAELEAIKVFATNLSDLLLAAPAGPKVTLGLDPGMRTGTKIAVVDETGKLVDTATIYPHAPQNQWDQSIATLAALCAKHEVRLLSIGNGTASRETDKLAKELGRKHPALALTPLVVSEAGASVYSASALAANEFPELDVSIRGAVSIARRLQDPLSELVKIEPKAIGVGQYQHDVSQAQLSRSLDAVVEDCVNAVGVDVNMASVPLLSQVSGLTKSMAENIVAYRDENGPFTNRKTLLAVPRLGPKAFEQAAGFLRIRGGDNPLDQSGVHPETYPLVETIIQKSARPITDILGDAHFVKGLKATDFISDAFGLVTVNDIFAELEKPGRDPRPEFKTAAFVDGVETIGHLKPDMILEGVVTNVANFGAFVDVGVHQDGLVHISALSNTFVKDPRTIVKVGDVVKVKVMQVDVDRKRIGLTMRLEDEAKNQNLDIARDKPGQGPSRTQQRKESSPPNARPARGNHPKSQDKHAGKAGGNDRKPPLNSAMADALAKAFKK